MTVRMTLSAVAAVSLLGVAACGDNQDDVVRAPDVDAAAAGQAQPVTEGVARHVTALGMDRDQLEDADLLSSERTKLGEVEAIIIDDDNNVTGFAIDVEGPGDRYVVIPVDQVTSIDIEGDRDLQTALTADQLNALPAWNRDTMRSPEPRNAPGATSPTATQGM
ncbi:MAG: PRC-barrel domain-containing protein [Brevundimonas sp.]|uniref:PRC-barrel domain-containing protein n=1 Tax=Brevundimonas sp. TaxID=1871086 RepID=UPI00391B7C58